MAMTQDELGNWYDDGFGSDSFHDFTGMSEGGAENVFDPTYGGQFSMNSGENVFDPTYGGQYGAGAESVFDPTYGGQLGNVAGENVFDPTYGGQFALPAGFSTRSLGVGGANAMPAGINTRSIFGAGANAVPTNTGGGGITDYLKSLDLTTAGGIAGALAGATGAFTNAPKKAYEGKIPQLQAVRNMVLAPPTANYRPGQGGVNYNADVFYAPRGTVPEGMTGTMTPAAQAAAANAARVAAVAPKKNSTLTNIAKTAGLAALAKQVLGGTGNKTTDGLKTIIDRVTGNTKTSGGTTVNGTRPGTNTAGNAGLAGAIINAITGGAKPGGVTPKGGGSAGGAGGTRGVGGGAGGAGGTGAAPNTEAIDDGTYIGVQEAIAEMNASPYNADGTLKEGYELDENNNPVLSGDNTLTMYNPDGSSSIIGRDAEQILSEQEIQAELERLSAERAAEIEAEEEAAIGGNSFHDFTGIDDAVVGGVGDDSRGYESLYSGFDFGSNDLDLSEFNLGGDDYAGFNFGGDFAKGGEINMAKGRYLQGNTDGMADKIPAQIGKKQPAALSHGEFVVPADVVSHLGNGNSDAGAKKLYQMMDRIRVARTGNKKQGKQINPDKFMPGGLANAYANGGKVKGFAGPEGSAVGATGLGSAVNAGITGTETGPNSWAGDYMSNMLGKTQALTESPYQQYMGPLSAGASGLQNQVFTGLQNTTFPGNLGQSFSSQGAYAAPTMGASGTTPPASTTPGQSQGIASQYMNPYLQGVLDPQLAELRRQNEITNMGTNAKMAQAGAFGGGRQAILNAENNRNLMQEMNKTVGQGYASAYDKGQQQFNVEQAQGRSLADLMAQQGNVQRGIEAEGMAADKSAFEAARENPYKMLQFQQSMLQGMPVSATSYNIAQPTKLQEIMAGAAGGAKAVGKSDKTIADLLQQLGL
jgi:hypothetical protein